VTAARRRGADDVVMLNALGAATLKAALAK
jgi:hypothetical protein